MLVNRITSYNVCYTKLLRQMLCDIPEEDWSTKKDPSSEQSNKDSSLRKFYTKGPTKKLAKSILGRLTRDNFIESIYHDDYAAERTDVVLESRITSYNVCYTKLLRFLCATDAFVGHTV